MKVGFPVRVGAPTAETEEQIVGRVALRPGSERVKLVPTERSCPLCHTSMFRTPEGVIAGRIVAVENGRAAVDLLPPELTTVSCTACGVTFFEPREGR